MQSQSACLISTLISWGYGLTAPNTHTIGPVNTSCGNMVFTASGFQVAARCHEHDGHCGITSPRGKEACYCASMATRHRIVAVEIVKMHDECFATVAKLIYSAVHQYLQHKVRRFGL